jgi:hypothetical protein
MKISLDRLDFICYTLKEIETMMTTDESVRKEVIGWIKRMVKPGNQVTKRDWKIAYQVARREAIRETLLWKQKYITIERS